VDEVQNKNKKLWSVILCRQNGMCTRSEQQKSKDKEKTDKTALFKLLMLSAFTS